MDHEEFLNLFMPDSWQNLWTQVIAWIGNSGRVPGRVMAIV